MAPGNFGGPQMASLHVPFPLCSHRSDPLANKPSLAQGPGTVSSRVSSSALTACAMIQQANQSLLQEVGLTFTLLLLHSLHAQPLSITFPGATSPVALHAVCVPPFLQPYYRPRINYGGAQLCSLWTSHNVRVGIPPFTNG